MGWDGSDRRGSVGIVGVLVLAEGVFVEVVVVALLDMAKLWWRAGMKRSAVNGC